MKLQPVKIRAKQFFNMIAKWGRHIEKSQDEVDFCVDLSSCDFRGTDLSEAGRLKVDMSDKDD